MSKHRAGRREVRPSRRAGGLARALVVTVVVGGLAVAAAQLEVGEPGASTPSAAAPSRALAAAVDPAPTADDAMLDPLAPVAVTDASALQAEDRATDPGLPDESGEGRRIVFSESDQRVWLVGADGSVERTYLVSGSRFDNLDPGTYSVQSRTRDATAFDASGTMEYFVRFATGFSEPIGFHSVPRDNEGVLEQTRADLGTPLSAGCVRQWEPDAIALWDFAPVGTAVVVTP